ncbi:MAG TPA: TonB-dependent receptor, partial [Syntrophorhabdaceae bacterium]|nr:TonB-dependent receptor [Syntrophorhabdaceae bacterium]
MVIFINHFCSGIDREENSLDKLARLNLEDLMKIEVKTVYSASKFIQKTTEAPSYVSVITSSDIKRYGYRRLADIINSLSGFYISYDRNYHYLGVRGFSPPGDYNTRILLLIDGHRINDNIYNTAYIGNDFLLDVDLIDRIEVIRGPSSSIYGSNAFFGAINIITKNGKDINGMEISGEAGSFDTYKQRLTFGKEFNKNLDILLSVSFFKSHGQSLYYKEFDNPATNNGRADGVDGERFNSFFANIRYLDFLLQGGFITREKTIPTAPWGSEFNTNLTNTNDTLGYLNLKFKKDVDKDTSFMSRLFYNYYYYDGNYLINYPPLTRVKDLAWGKSWGGELQYNKRVFERHLITSGFEYQDNFLQKQRNYDESPYAHHLNDRRNSYQWGVFLQDEITLLDNLILNAGMRYDYFKLFHGNTSPRAALIYNPFEETTLKFLYGEAFRTPNVYELFYNDGNITQKANTDLDYEKIQTYEIVLEQYYKNLRLTISGFYYKIKNLITLTTDPSDGLLVFRN